LGFSLCTVIAFGYVRHSLQIKCTYHFRNKHGDSRDLDCYLHGCYDEKRIDSPHIFVGFDPCVVAKKDYMFSEYSEVSVEFQLEDKNRNFLCHYQVVECGVHLLYDRGEFRLHLLHTNDEDKIQHFPLIMSDSSRFYPLDRDELETRFQSKRARFQADRWEDYLRRTCKFLADLQVCFLNL
jgi:hypothetical protein